MKVIILSSILICFINISNIFARSPAKDYNSSLDETKIIQDNQISSEIKTDLIKPLHTNVIDIAFTKIGLNQYNETDPDIIKKLLKETHLDTFESSFRPFQTHINNMKNNPQDLKKILTITKMGLTKNKPLYELIQTGVKKNWFKKSDHIKKAIHMLYLFENFTLAAGNNVTILKELQIHFLNERKKYGINSKNILNTFIHVGRRYGKFFEPAKLLSVDPAVTSSIYEREKGGNFLSKKEINELFKKKKINRLERTIMTPLKAPDHNRGLQTNILEASITEFDYGYKDNAMAGYALIHSLKLQEEKYYYKKGYIIPEYYDYDETLDYLADNDNFYLVNELSQEWINLYTSWNAAFVFTEFNDLHLLLPKLFIPAQINTKANLYMYNRIISLWHAINFTLFRTLDKTPSVIGPTNKKEIIKEWGKINKKYALKYIAEDLKNKPKEFEKKFRSFFSYRYWELFKLMKHFLGF